MKMFGRKQNWGNVSGKYNYGSIGTMPLFICV